MGRNPFTARRAIFATVATFAASMMVSVSGAEAVVVNDSGTVAGVSLVPTARNGAMPSGVSAVTSASACTDPWLSRDLGGPSMPSAGLCYRGGAVMHKNEVFALTWDQHRSYWSETHGYVEQFLRDVADASGSLASPFAVTTQYNDGGGRAQNDSIFAGGCIDSGTVGGSACEFGAPAGAGHDFPTNGCTPNGDSFIAMDNVLGNSYCLTDAQLRSELATMVSQTGILSRTTPGYTPMVTLLLPPGVEACLDGLGSLCSVNHYLTPPLPAVSSNATGGSIPAGTYRIAVTYQTGSGESVASAQTVTTTGGTSSVTISSPPVAAGVTGWYAYATASNGATFRKQAGATAIGTDVTLTSLTAGGAPPSQPAFCSYHSQVNVSGTEVAYVVQPWSAGTLCDEPDVPAIPAGPTPHQLSVAIGQRLVSPLSQSEIAAIVNPAFNGWANNSGTEIDDNLDNAGLPCQPVSNGLDTVTVGSSSQNPYYLQREYDNAAALEFEPYTYFGCAPVVNLSAFFVAPSAINQGDEVQFDGASTPSTLMIPSGGYAWNFGDGTATATGPSVVHAFAKAGTYTVTLHITDRGGNPSSYSQVVTVLTTSGTPAPPPSTGGTGGTGATGSGGGTKPTQPLTVHLQLMPESLNAALAWGMRLRVNSNQSANGLVTVSIPRAAAKRAHIAVGASATVVIGRGTVSQVHSGTITLRLGLSRRMARKLHALRHVTMTVRLALVPAVGRPMTIVIAGRY